MAGRKAMAEITLALARAMAEVQPGFAEAVGTHLRLGLRRLSHRDRAFKEAMRWLERFERDGEAKPPRDARAPTGRKRRSPG